MAAFPNSGDTGADISAAATDGTRDAFLQGNSGIYNIAGQIITAGDIYNYSRDWVLAGRGPATVQLGYWNGSSVVLIPGTDSSAPGGTGPMLGLGSSYAVLAGDPAIGNPVVLTVNAPMVPIIPKWIISSWTSSQREVSPPTPRISPLTSMALQQLCHGRRIIWVGFFNRRPTACLLDLSNNFGSMCPSRDQSLASIFGSSNIRFRCISASPSSVIPSGLA